MKGTAQGKQAAAKAIRTGKMANTLAKALAKRDAKRWQFIDFLGPKGRESAGIVDIVAIRKCGKPPLLDGLKKLDLFDIILIQVKGGSAPSPTADDMQRLRKVATYYHAQEVVLFEWKEKKKSVFSKLGKADKWVEASASSLFGQK